MFGLFKRNKETKQEEDNKKEWLKESIEWLESEVNYLVDLKIKQDLLNLNSKEEAIEYLKKKYIYGDYTIFPDYNRMWKSSRFYTESHDKEKVLEKEREFNSEFANTYKHLSYNLAFSIRKYFSNMFNKLYIEIEFPNDEDMYSFKHYCIENGVKDSDPFIYTTMYNYIKEYKDKFY